MASMDSLPLTIAKKAAAQAALPFIQDGMLVGLGTGSTAAYFIEFLKQKCEEGLNIQAVATSSRSARQALALGIPLVDDQLIHHIDVGVDGADEISPDRSMIKGGGGALLREKIVAASCQKWIVIIDETKLVPRLGTFPVPVEIAHFAYQTTLTRLVEAGYQAKIRLERDGSLYYTDNGNYIADIQFRNPIENPLQEHLKLLQITGVLETGFFFNVADKIIVGYEDGFAKIQDEVKKH